MNPCYLAKILKNSEFRSTSGPSCSG